MFMSRLLFITQKVDKDDDVLGVYHRWIEELSKKVDKINVICLYKGRLELPSNVGVFSLGKDKLSDADLRGLKRGFTRIKYTIRFWKYIWKLKRDHDTVFVHMNPIYVVLGGIFWKLSRKKIFLWYNHPLGNLTAKIGIKLADRVFCTSPYSFSARYGKTSLMPAGIDTDFFHPMPEISKNNKQILYLGRISPIKKIEHLIEAAKILDGRGLDFKVLIIGSPGSSLADREYELRLKKISSDLLSKNKIEFKSAVSNHQTPEVYNSSGIFVNLTPTGSLDKTILEAMACGTVVLVSNKAFINLFNKEAMEKCMFAEGNFLDLAVKIEHLLSLPASQKTELGRQSRDIVIRHHSLAGLIDQLTELANV